MMKLKTLLNHKYFYYFSVFLMIVNVLGYVSLGSIECVLVFGGAAYAANHFTKNRALDIFIGLFASNVLFGCGRVREGMKGGTEKVREGATAMMKEAKDNDDEKKAHSAAAIHGEANECDDEECKKKKPAAAAAQ
jgi:hypothetical protein